MVCGLARHSHRTDCGEWRIEDEAPTLPFLHRVVAWQGPPPPFVPCTWGMTIEWLRILAAAQATGRRLKPIPGHAVHRGGRGRPRSGCR